MISDKVYFDSLSFPLLKGRYYDRAQVDAALSEIRHRGLSLVAENEELKERLAKMEQQSDEVRQVLLTANASSRRLLEEAATRAADTMATAEKDAAATRAAAEKEATALSRQAARVLADARIRADAIVSQARVSAGQSGEFVTRQQEQMVAQCEALVSSLRDFYTEGISLINTQWQEFLCSLPEAEEAPAMSDSFRDNPSAASAASAGVPSDLSEKVNAIARIMELD